MFHALQSLAGEAVMQRATLFANHVIGAEPAAMQRLVPHAGRTIRLDFEGWPTALPPLPPTGFRITPAGLLEWSGTQTPDSVDLHVAIDASNPALAFVRSLAGERPRVVVSGDAAFAGDVNWLIDHLRWDVQDDLQRLVGAGPASELSRLAGGFAQGLREMLRAVGGLAERARGGPAEPPRS